MCRYDVVNNILYKMEAHFPQLAYALTSFKSNPSCLKYFLQTFSYIKGGKCLIDFVKEGPWNFLLKILHSMCFYTPYSKYCSSNGHMSTIMYDLFQNVLACEENSAFAKLITTPARIILEANCFIPRCEENSLYIREIMRATNIMEKIKQKFHCQTFSPEHIHFLTKCLKEEKEQTLKKANSKQTLGFLDLAI